MLCNVLIYVAFWPHSIKPSESCENQSWTLEDLQQRFRVGTRIGFRIRQAPTAELAHPTVADAYGGHLIVVLSPGALSWTIASVCCAARARAPVRTNSAPEAVTTTRTIINQWSSSSTSQSSQVPSAHFAMTTTCEGPCGLPFVCEDALLLTCFHPVCADCARTGKTGSAVAPCAAVRHMPALRYHLRMR